MTSGAVIAIAMTLNELCTNTTKFGALSVPQGRVDISWTLDQQAQRLHLTWTEKNGAAVRPPEKRSFGTRLIETLGRQLRGDVRLTYEPTGFVYAFDVPMASLTSAARGIYTRPCIPERHVSGKPNSADTAPFVRTATDLSGTASWCRARDLECRTLCDLSSGARYSTL